MSVVDDLRSLEHWDTLEDFSVFQAICLWLDYVPRMKWENREYPHKWGAIYRMFVDLIRHRQLIARLSSKPKEIIGTYKDYPFDTPVNYDNCVVDKASPKKGILSSLQSIVNRLGFGEEAKVGLNEYPIYITYLKRKDLKRIADQTSYRPLFLYPDERKGKKLSDMWPEKSAIVPPDKKAEPVPITPKVKVKANKAQTKQKNPPKRKPKPIESKIASPASGTDKGKLNILHKQIESITRSLFKDKRSITTPEIANSNEVKVALEEHKKRKWPDVEKKTIHDWIRAALKEMRGPLRVGRPSKKSLR